MKRTLMILLFKFTITNGFIYNYATLLLIIINFPIDNMYIKKKL